MNIVLGGKKYAHILLHLFFFIFIASSNAETIKIVTYNILNFPDAIGMQRIDDFRKIIDFEYPDILVVQEMQSQEGIDLFIDSVMNYQENLFEVVPFNDGPDTDNALFYRSNKVEYLSSQYLPTPIRDIAEYRLKIIDSQREFYIFSVHFKSAQGSNNETIRQQEATILRNHVDSLDPGTNFLVMGDFNIYYSDEPAFHTLTDNLANNNGRLFDPLNASGDWHENSDFAYLHTQSSRTEQLQDSGAGGGLDDRFDMILCSQSFLDSAGLYIISDSYTICGNDENHFNIAVNYGVNQSVPDDIADALYYASDHLPVIVTITDGIEQDIPKEVVKIWPNPMKTEAQIRFPWHDDFQKANVTITNILGQRVYVAETQSPTDFTLRRGKLPVGIYFVHVEIEGTYNDHNYYSKLAVVQ